MPTTLSSSRGASIRLGLGNSSLRRACLDALPSTAGCLSRVIRTASCNVNAGCANSGVAASSTISDCLINQGRCNHLATGDTPRKIAHEVTRLLNTASIRTIGSVETRDDADVRLARALMEGKVEAFDDFVENFRTRVFQYSYLMCGHREDAEEVAQDTLLKVFENFAALRVPKGCLMGVSDCKEYLPDETPA